MTIFSVYDSIADFIATLNPKKVLDLKATPEMQQRIQELIEQEKSSPLSKEEKDELDHYIVLERLIRLSKARALYILSQ